MAHISSLVISRTVYLAVVVVLAFTCIMAGESASAAEKTLYASTQTPLHDAPANGEDIANIMPGTKLRVLKESNGQLEVEITGWSQEGAEKYLFRDIGQRIRLAKLTDKGLAGRVVIAQKEDYYESVWQDVKLTGWIAKNDTDKDLAHIWKTASQLFHQRCTRCHALHRASEFTANQWPSILKIMTARAGLSAGRKSLITQYLQTHAKGQKGAGEIAEETQTPASQENPKKPEITGDAKLAAKGAKLFREYSCHACHGDNARTPAIPAYPKLAGQNADYAFKQMQDFKTGTRANDQYEVMRESLANVPQADMRAIAYWLSTQ